MNKYIINTGTITYALRGRDALRSRGYTAYMHRMTGKSAVGCGYSVSTDCDEAVIKDIFKSEGIKYVSIVPGEKI